MTDDIQMPIDVDTSELKEKLTSFVDNLTRIDVAREANNDIIKDIKNMGYKPFVVGFTAMLTVGVVSIITIETYINFFI